MITPYGAAALVDRHASRDDETIITGLARSGSLAIDCDDDTVLECSRIADGSLTPIDGFFDRDETDSVIASGAFGRGRYFPLPILLPAPGLDVGLRGETILLRTAGGAAFGMLSGASVFRYDLAKLCRGVFGVEDARHAGVARVMRGGDTFASGRLTMSPRPNALSAYCLAPAQAREEIARRGWTTCTGFQTRNVPHLAHEYLQRVALETSDGLLIHPIIGWKKADDYRPEVVMAAYRYMVDEIYPPPRVLLSGLQMQMRYAGPKEAVMHAIVRQNFGCTHFIVGRDHAGVGGYYGKYDAHRIFDRVQEHLDVRILRLKGPFHCDRCRMISTESTCGHTEADRREISGTLVREMLSRGEYPPVEFMRRGVVDAILKHEETFVAGGRAQ